jgi:hypothetical protein
MASLVQPQKNFKVLSSFVDYCLEHPEERFWQALRNWSGSNFILASSHSPHCTQSDVFYVDLQDTFYWKGKTK